ncbi:WXG100 family type VII secretion target [Nocardia sp. NPDC004278]|uniref:WXG100 family type VII secretion target n=1 Tax=unclassified Nocardia TaxID=2637762 RepID=UPI0033A2FD23
MVDILYDPATMTALHDELEGAHKDLNHEASNLVDTAKRFHQALQGDQAKAAFDGVFKNWSDEYDNNLVVLQKLYDSVNDAMHRARQADGVVADGFSGF